MNGYITVKEASEKWLISVRNVQALCAAEKIKGALKLSNMWIIPEDAEYPVDGRIKSGKYISWRKSK